MYCGNNKTALSSQKQISDALLALLKRKPFSDISVCEICKEAQISRQTFYSLFQSKENVICYELQQNYCFQPEEGQTEEGFSLRGLCRAYSRYIEAERPIISMLVSNQIITCLHQSMLQEFLACPCFLEGSAESDRIFAADFIAGGLTGIAKNYVLYRPEGDQAYLEETIYRLFSGSFFPE